MTPTALKLAKVLHDAYTRRGPQCGFEVREETKEFDENSPIGQLLLAVCEDVLEWMDSELLT